MRIYEIYMIQFLRLFFGGFIMRDKLAYEWGIPIAISLLAVGLCFLYVFQHLSVVILCFHHNQRFIF